MRVGSFTRQVTPTIQVLGSQVFLSSTFTKSEEGEEIYSTD